MNSLCTRSSTFELVFKKASYSLRNNPTLHSSPSKALYATSNQSRSKTVRTKSEPTSSLTLPIMANIDPRGTCSIHYNSPNPFFPYSSFPKPENMAAVRRIEYHFHMTKNPDDRPSVVFFREGPLRHWIDQPQGVPVPPLTLGVSSTEEFSLEYREAIDSLFCLIEVLGESWPGTVVVKLSTTSFRNVIWRDTLRRCFEEYLGPGFVFPLLEGQTVKYDPRHWRENGQNRAG